MEYSTLSNTCSCKLLCKSCGICPHLFSCTCLDSTLHFTVCKHIHLIAIANNLQLVTEETNTDNLAYFSEILSSEVNHKSTDSTILKEQLGTMISQLQVTISTSNNSEALRTAIKHIQSAITVIKAMPQQETITHKLPVKRSYAPNSNHEQQLTFFSTKKKRLSLSQAISKPSMNQLQKQKSKLKSEEPKFCGVCMKENDASNSNVIDWIQCSLCGLWIHELCTTISEEPLNYTCHFCSP